MSRHHRLSVNVLTFTHIAFGFALAWRTRSLSWWIAFPVGLTLSWIVAEGLSRKRVRVHVALHCQRSLVTAVAMFATLVGGVVLSGADIRPQRGTLEEAYEICALVLGVVLGYALRRAAGQAASSSLVESDASEVKIKSILCTTAIVIAIPPAGTPMVALYFFGLASGIFMHWLERELQYRGSARRRVRYLDALNEAITPTEYRALRQLLLPGGRPMRLYAEDITSYPGSMIAAVSGWSSAAPQVALESLRKAASRANDKEQAAKVEAVRARVLHDIGDASGVRDALQKLEALEPTCPVRVAANLLLGEPLSGSPEEARSAFGELLAATERARKPLQTVAEHVVSKAYSVDEWFFKTGLVASLRKLGNLDYAAELSDSVVRMNPRCPFARFQQGLTFKSLRERSSDPSEQAEYLDVAVIAFTLAIEFSPHQSLTAARAREQLKALGAPKGGS